MPILRQARVSLRPRDRTLQGRSGTFAPRCPHHPQGTPLCRDTGAGQAQPTAPGHRGVLRWPNYQSRPAHRATRVRAAWRAPSCRMERVRPGRQHLEPSAAKMKARRAHAVPLSFQVRHAQRTSHVHRLRQICVSFGLRATASTLLNESGLWNPDAIERALAHGERNATRGAYHRGLHWDERVRMAQWWSDFLDGLRQA